MRKLLAITGLALVLGGVVCGCGTLTHKVIVPEPIHITVDVNVRVQKELHEFFKDIDEVE